MLLQVELIYHQTNLIQFLVILMPWKNKNKKILKIINIPIKPISSPIIAKIKSVCPSGIKPLCLKTLSPIPLPKKPPFANANTEKYDWSYNSFPPNEYNQLNNRSCWYLW